MGQANLPLSEGPSSEDTKSPYQKHPELRKMAGSSFTCFPNLPPELRALVFNLALPGPRLITLSVQPGSPSCTIEATASHMDTLTASYYTCRESNIIMRTRYRSFLHRHVSKRYPVWIDTSIDTIYVPNINVSDHLMRPNGKHTNLRKSDLGPVQRLALEAPIIPNRFVSKTLDCDLAQWQFAAIKCFPELRRIIFVPRFVVFDHKFAGQLIGRFRHMYREHGDVLEVQDEWILNFLGS